MKLPNVTWIMQTINVNNACDYLRHFRTLLRKSCFTVFHPVEISFPESNSGVKMNAQFFYPFGKNNG